MVALVNAATQEFWELPENFYHLLMEMMFSNLMLMKKSLNTTLALLMFIGSELTLFIKIIMNF